MKKHLEERFQPCNLFELETRLGRVFSKKSINLVGSRPEYEVALAQNTMWMLEQCKELSAQKTHVLLIVQEKKLQEYLEALSGEVNLDYLHFVEETHLTPRKLEILMHRLYRKINADPAYVFIESLQQIMTEDQQMWADEETLNSIVSGLEGVVVRMKSIFFFGVSLTRYVEGKIERNDYIEEFDRYEAITKRAKSIVTFNANREMLILK